MSEPGMEWGLTTQSFFARLGLAEWPKVDGPWMSLAHCSEATSLALMEEC